jgi:hypothetical protein
VVGVYAPDPISKKNQSQISRDFSVFHFFFSEPK